MKTVCTNTERYQELNLATTPYVTTAADLFVCSTLGNWGLRQLIPEVILLTRNFLITSGRVSHIAPPGEECYTDVDSMVTLRLKLADQFLYIEVEKVVETSPEIECLIQPSGGKPPLASVRLHQSELRIRR